MKFLTRMQSKVFDKLCILAQGDSLLVERALREYGSGDMKDVITFIKKEVESKVQKTKHKG